MSFYEVPSANFSPQYLADIGDVIPAGLGMKNVQLLVVDRNDKNRVCNIGEVGEIYVRAGGLAEGYLGLELEGLTNTKFVQNWFVDPQKWAAEDEKKVQEQGRAEPWRQYYKGPRVSATSGKHRIGCLTLVPNARARIGCTALAISGGT